MRFFCCLIVFLPWRCGNEGATHSRSTFSWCLSQLPYRVLDDLIHELSIGNGVSYETVPMQPHVSRPMFAFAHQSLHAPLPAERVIRWRSREGGIGSRCAFRPDVRFRNGAPLEPLCTLTYGPDREPQADYTQLWLKAMSVRS